MLPKEVIVLFGDGDADEVVDAEGSAVTGTTTAPLVAPFSGDGDTGGADAIAGNDPGTVTTTVLLGSFAVVVEGPDELQPVAPSTTPATARPNPA